MVVAKQKSGIHQENHLRRTFVFLHIKPYNMDIVEVW